MNEQLSFGGIGSGPTRPWDEPPSQNRNAAMTEETAIDLMTQMRRDLLREVEWKLEYGLPRRGPTGAEAALAIGSLLTGSLVTAVVVGSSTTVMTGFLGMQSSSHWNALPFVLIIWLSVLAVNLVWARRR